MNPQQPQYPPQQPYGQPPVVVVKKGTSALVIVLAVIGGILVLGFGGCLLCVGVAGKGIADAEKKAQADKQEKQEAVQVKSKDDDGKPGKPGTEKAVAKGVDATAKIGDTVMFEDSEWTILEAKDLGSTAPSNNQFEQAGKSDDGHFVRVKFSIKNKGKKDDMLFDQPKLQDSQGREFTHSEHEMFYVPENAKTLGLEKIPVGLKKEYFSVYEIPKDAKGIKFVARALETDGATKPIDLGM